MRNPWIYNNGWNLKAFNDQQASEKAQHRFIPLRSCLSDLLETLEFITTSLYDSQNVDEVLLDFQKPSILSPKTLCALASGIWLADGLLKRFKNYLNNRRQNDIVGGESSSWIEVLNGVPLRSQEHVALRCIHQWSPRMSRWKIETDDSRLLSVVWDEKDVNNLLMDTIK